MRSATEGTPPKGDWALEIFISGPRLEHLGAGVWMAPFDPVTHVGTYKLCRVTTRPGRFTIEARLSVQDGPIWVNGLIVTVPA